MPIGIFALNTCKRGMTAGATDFVEYVPLFAEFKLDNLTADEKRQALLLHMFVPEWQILRRVFKDSNVD